jgi:two-component system chemotaxis response regulator CheY
MARASIPASGPRTAIVVDDSRVMRAILRHALEAREFGVVEAIHGRHALELLTAMPVPDLALIDWNMPELDGLELIRVLRSDPRYESMAIVMVTSETEPAQIQRALSMGADEYIMKPLSPEVLMERLVQLEVQVLR